MLAPRRRLNSAHVEMLTLTSGSSAIDQLYQLYTFYQPRPSQAPNKSRAEPNRAQNKASSRAPNKAVPSRAQPRIRPYRGEPSRASSQAELSGEPISVNMFCVIYRKYDIRLSGKTHLLQFFTQFYLNSCFALTTKIMLLFKFSQFCKVKNYKTIGDAKQGVEIDNFLLESILNFECNRRVIFRPPRVPGKKQRTCKNGVLDFDKTHIFFNM